MAQERQRCTQVLGLQGLENNSYYHSRGNYYQRHTYHIGEPTGSNVNNSSNGVKGIRGMGHIIFMNGPGINGSSVFGTLLNTEAHAVGTPNAAISVAYKRCRCRGPGATKGTRG